MSRKPTQPQQGDAPNIETMQVFIKTEKEDEKKEADTQYKHLFPGKKSCLEPVKSKR
jgi:hypothetical protein